MNCKVHILTTCSGLHLKVWYLPILATTHVAMTSRIHKLADSIPAFYARKSRVEISARRQAILMSSVVFFSSLK
jgi:hypothetical protein